MPWSKNTFFPPLASRCFPVCTFQFTRLDKYFFSFLLSVFSRSSLLRELMKRGLKGFERVRDRQKEKWTEQQKTLGVGIMFLYLGPYISTVNKHCSFYSKDLKRKKVWVWLLRLRIWLPFGVGLALISCISSFSGLEDGVCVFMPSGMRWDLVN